MSGRMVVTDICVSEERIIYVPGKSICVEFLGSVVRVRTVFRNLRKNLLIGTTLCYRRLEHSLYISSQKL